MCRLIICKMYLPNHGEYITQGGACDVMVIVVGNGHGDTSSKSWKILIAFHIALISLGKI